MAQPYDHFYLAELDRVAAKPTTATWLKHLAFLGITFCTATIAGVCPPFGQGVSFPALDLPIWNDTAELIAWAPTLYSMFIVDVVAKLLTDTSFLTDGLTFSVPLLIILVSHEM